MDINQSALNYQANRAKVSRQFDASRILPYITMMPKVDNINGFWWSASLHMDSSAIGIALHRI